MTYDAAYASFAEHRVGSLQPGKRADYVVLNQDIMSIPDDEILDTKVIATVRFYGISLSVGSHVDASP
jgi:predicted amidohydrolase YtcJ